MTDVLEALCGFFGLASIVLFFVGLPETFDLLLGWPKYGLLGWYVWTFAMGAVCGDWAGRRRRDGK